jgi:hypothetical protein
MSPNCATENAKFAAKLNHLGQFNDFISGIAAAIVASDQDFESVWSIANRVYDRHASPKLRFINRAGFDQSKTTALSA